MIAEFLTRMTARHEVAVLCLRRSSEPGPDMFFQERCTRIDEILLSSRSPSFPDHLRRAREIFFSLVRLCPIWVMDWHSQEYVEKLQSVIKSFQPEIVQAEYHVMGQYLSAVPDLPRVLVQYEPGVRAAPFIQNLPLALKRILQGLERLSWRRYEAGLYRQVQAIVAFTEADHRVIADMAGQTPVHLISPGTELPATPLNPLGSAALNLLFFGNFIHPPNVDAARRLMQMIFPMVQGRLPAVKLFIVGDNVPDEIKRMSTEHMVVTGRVPDLASYLNQASLVVTPIYQGGGIRIKVLEALAAGKAVVATPLAVQGLDLQDGQQVALARNDHDFAGRVIHLLEHPEERAELARRARAWACTHLGWDRSISSFEILWHGLLSQE